MNVATISMDRGKAREAFQVYRAEVKRRHNDEYEILMRGYKHLAQGKQVLDLVASMKKAGLDHLGRPRLAIARADWEWVWYRRSGWNQNGPRFSKMQYVNGNETQRYTLLPETLWPINNIENIKVRVPTVPPNLKPVGSLNRFHILWEPDWEQEPPTDPILLRHLGRSLYAVLAMWDLTELERSLLR